MSRKLDLSAFAGDDEEDEAAVFQPKVRRAWLDERTTMSGPLRRAAADTSQSLSLNQLKSKTFSHGITKKSKKDLEREAEERKKRDEEECVGVDDSRSGLWRRRGAELMPLGL